jgi:hypothetical protein
MFSILNPNNGIRADLCIVVLVRLERIVDATIDFLIVTHLFASVMFGALLDCKRPCKPIVRFRKIGSMIDVRLASYKWLRRGVSFSSLVTWFLQWRALSGIKETISESSLWLHARRLRIISSLHSPSSHVKFAKDK